MLFSQGIYFTEPTSNHIDYIDIGGAGPIAYNFYHHPSIYVYTYYAKLTYPGGSQSNWMVGETSGWWVTKAGTYQIQGKAWVQSIYGGSAYWAYRSSFSFQVVDNYAPTQPQNVSVGPDPEYSLLKVTWDSNSEYDIEGYEVSRKITGRLSHDWEIVESLTINNYFIDPNYEYCPGGGDYYCYYKIRAKDINNHYSVYSDEATAQADLVEKISSETPAKQYSNLLAQEDNSFLLHHNYPNPFNSTTVINYSLPKSGFVTLKIYDLLGKEIMTLVEGVEQEGLHSIQFNAKNLQSGVYFYQLQSDEFIVARKLILMK